MYYNRFNRIVGEFEGKEITFSPLRRKRKGKEGYFNNGGEFA
jgi:hypothetical protein